MKKILYLIALAIAITSCKKNQNNFVSFSGKITNQNSDSIVISNPEFNFKRIIKVDENGMFKDTMNVKKGFYRLNDGTETAYIFIKNGADINMTIDCKKFDETIAFTGEGSSENNFIAKSNLLKEEELYNDKTLFDLPKTEFDAKMSNFTNNFNKILASSPKLDSVFVDVQNKWITKAIEVYKKRYQDKLILSTGLLSKDKPSPKFTDYENFKGGTTSLDDLKGKYVYIDIWATWCNPCKKEIPFLQKIEKKYHGKNIEFVSISIDAKKDHETWEKMISDKQLTGIQLFADNSWQSEFIKEYKIKSIPRFILIDPKGNIVSADAPRPSNPDLIEILDSLKI